MTGDRIALGIVGLAAVILVVNLVLALAAPKPTPAPEQAPACTDPDGACIGWSELHYPGIEWRTD